MKVKDGDIIEFIAMRWDENWEFDHPAVLISPIKDYSDDGRSSEQMIEDACIDACIDGMKEYKAEEEFKFRGWNWSKLKRIANNYLAGNKNEWKTKSVFVCKQKVRFFLNEDYELESEVLETQEA
jgi:hypothetical protein